MFKSFCAAVSVACLLSGTVHAEGGRRAALQPWTDGAKPNIALSDLTGTLHDMSHRRGEVVLVHFFATWCEPCIPELTSLRTLVDRSKDRPVTVLAVDVGEVDLRVRRFFERLPVNFPILMDRDGAVTKAWDVFALPTTYVLDGELQPRFVAVGDIDWTDPDVAHLVDSLIETNLEQEKQL
jgi:peroxiredoxin